MPTETQRHASSANLIAFDKWLEDRGSSRTTGYRLRERGLIKVVNIYGRLYIAREEIDQFEARAANGEFARKHTPVRKFARRPKNRVRR